MHHATIEALLILGSITVRLTVHYSEPSLEDPGWGFPWTPSEDSVKSNTVYGEHQETRWWVAAAAWFVELGSCQDGQYSNTACGALPVIPNHLEKSTTQKENSEFWNHTSTQVSNTPAFYLEYLAILAYDLATRQPDSNMHRNRQDIWPPLYLLQGWRRKEYNLE